MADAEPGKTIDPTGVRRKEPESLGIGTKLATTFRTRSRCDPNQDTIGNRLADHLALTSGYGPTSSIHDVPTNLDCSPIVCRGATIRATFGHLRLVHFQCGTYRPQAGAYGHATSVEFDAVDAKRKLRSLGRRSGNHISHLTGQLCSFGDSRTIREGDVLLNSRGQRCTFVRAA